MFAYIFCVSSQFAVFFFFSSIAINNDFFINIVFDTMLLVVLTFYLFTPTHISR